METNVCQTYCSNKTNIQQVWPKTLPLKENNFVKRLLNDKLKFYLSSDNFIVLKLLVFDLIKLVFDH